MPEKASPSITMTFYEIIDCNHTGVTAEVIDENGQSVAVFENFEEKMEIQPGQGQGGIKSSKQRYQTSR